MTIFVSYVIGIILMMLAVAFIPEVTAISALLFCTYKLCDKINKTLKKKRPEYETD